MLNDPQIVEASRVLASNVLTSEGSARERIEAMFRRITSRTCTQQELEILDAQLQEAMTTFSNDAEAAKALISIGEYPVDESLNASELAAYTLVANTIFNLDESLNRG